MVAEHGRRSGDPVRTPGEDKQPLLAAAQGVEAAPIAAPALPQYWGLEANERNGEDSDDDDDGGFIPMGRMNADGHLMTGRRPDLQQQLARVEAYFLATQCSPAGLMATEDAEDVDDVSTGVASDAWESPNGLSVAEATGGVLVGDLPNIVEDDGAAEASLTDQHRFLPTGERNQRRYPLRRISVGCAVL
mmetsp:Transcript_32148/g.75497  ORF Transcript_32148/g.75497 Transcript_32148/m.75497 type:complete len:190 (-) Transcript_32148:32-601(-)